MPVNNPYAFGALSGGMGTGGAYNPYGGFLQSLLQQQQQSRQDTYADALTKLREMISRMSTQPQPQQGALAGATSAPPPATPQVDDLYNQGDYFKNLGSTESTNSYTIVNPKSGAGGKYQFIEPTWNSLMKSNPELGLTPEGRTAATTEGQGQQERAVRALTQQNVPILREALGRAPTHTETYLAHLLGPGYATAVLRAPDTPVQALVPQSFIDANPFLKGISGRQLVQLFAKKFR